VTEVTIDVPVEPVWHALRDRAELRRWHGWDYPEIDAEIEQIYFTEAVADEATRTVTTGGTEIRVTPGTTVTFRMTAPPEDPMWQGWYETVREGWVTFAQQLRYALERHPGEDRTTVYVEAPQERPEVGAPGERYAWHGVTGEVWFRSEHQLGLTVDQWGAGLLVLQDGSAVATGYGVTPGWGAA
jgi:uncharacterized protein YndB with AHSA1/START domain